MFNYRRKLEFLLLFFLILFALSAMGSEWIGWVTIIAMFSVLIIIDFMFLDDSSFVFDPEQKNWERRTTTVY